MPAHTVLLREWSTSQGDVLGKDRLVLNRYMESISKSGLRQAVRGRCLAVDSGHRRAGIIGQKFAHITPPGTIRKGVWRQSPPLARSAFSSVDTTPKVALICPSKTRNVFVSHLASVLPRAAHRPRGSFPLDCRVAESRPTERVRWLADGGLLTAVQHLLLRIRVVVGGGGEGLLVGDVRVLEALGGRRDCDKQGSRPRNVCDSPVTPAQPVGVPCPAPAFVFLPSQSVLNGYVAGVNSSERRYTVHPTLPVSFLFVQEALILSRSLAYVYRPTPLAVSSQARECRAWTVGSRMLWERSTDVSYRRIFSRTARQAPPQRHSALGGASFPNPPIYQSHQPTTVAGQGHSSDRCGLLSDSALRFTRWPHCNVSSSNLQSNIYTVSNHSSAMGSTSLLVFAHL